MLNNILSNFFVKKILIVVPTQFEANALQTGLKSLQEKLSANYEVQVSVCGAGLVASAVGTVQAYNDSKPDLIWLMGIAGAYANLEIGSVVQIERMVLADFGAQENNGAFLSASELGFGIQEYTCTTPFLNAISSASVQCASGLNQTAQERQLFSKAQIEEMEGASIAALCILWKIPMWHTRAISNRAGFRNKNRWNIPLALNNLNQWLLEL